MLSACKIVAPNLKDFREILYWIYLGNFLRKSNFGKQSEKNIINFTLRPKYFYAEFYVLLTVHLCKISKINSIRCTILFNIFIYFSALNVSDFHVPIIRRKLLYPCDTGICHSVWVPYGLLVSRPDATHTEWQARTSVAWIQYLLLMMGTWMPETCRAEK